MREVMKLDMSSQQDAVKVFSGHCLRHLLGTELVRAVEQFKN